jgi:hypothetical protein
LRGRRSSGLRWRIFSRSKNGSIATLWKSVSGSSLVEVLGRGVCLDLFFYLWRGCNTLRKVVNENVRAPVSNEL